MAKEFTLSGKAKVSFDLSDPGLVQRLHEAVCEIKKLHKVLFSAGKNGDMAEYFDVSKRCDKEARAIIDRTLCAPVCEAVFGSTSVFALAGGQTLWLNLMQAVIAAIDTSFPKEQKASGSKIKRHKKRRRKK